MKTELIQSLTSTFEAHAQQTEGGTEHWLARDLQYLLGYAEWRNFNNTVISKAKMACELSGHAVSDHFVDVNKTISTHPHQSADSSRRLIKRLIGAARKLNGEPIDASVNTKYRNQHIRPLAVRPLNYPEREPTPWGFLFCPPQISTDCSITELSA